MGFRLVTLNLNGIRSAAGKGFLAWAEKAGADCMCVQEVKAQHAGRALRAHRPAQGSFSLCAKKGYCGVGVYTRKNPSEVIAELRVGWRLDYHLATPGIAALARREQIFTARRIHAAHTAHHTTTKQAVDAQGVLNPGVLFDALNRSVGITGALAPVA